VADNWQMDDAVVCLEHANLHGVGLTTKKKCRATDQAYRIGKLGKKIISLQ